VKIFFSWIKLNWNIYKNAKDGCLAGGKQSALARSFPNRKCGLPSQYTISEGAQLTGSAPCVLLGSNKNGKPQCASQVILTGQLAPTFPELAFNGVK
jgi:hypothetical protein